MFGIQYLHDYQKRNRSNNVKFEYIVIYENSSDRFDIRHCRIKVKVTVGVGEIFLYIHQYKLSVL